MSKLPSGELSITKKGDKLYLRPLSPYRYNQPSLIQEDSSSESSESLETSYDQDPSHQRTSTIIIKDIAQSYTFIPAIKNTNKNIIHEDIQSYGSNLLKKCYSSSNDEQSEDYEKDSIMISTMDPKSPLFKKNLYQGRETSIVTISSTSSEKNLKFKNFPGRNCKSRMRNRNSLFKSVTAFCSKCEQNINTEVRENQYMGTFWEKLLCNICYSDSKIREFSHVCKICESPVFRIKLRVE
ncbi:hypothetical protein SteCoe_13062 [Stentor coeruleus]|uniref:Uncharacterized protein n=1 Tax=Stentor coeruleus TaxID=5963 RepID=A0A1R2C9B1_9CILI|nr:hypothetical protein SteCoe_13062 [Stentor coeruleus]